MHDPSTDPLGMSLDIPSLKRLTPTAVFGSSQTSNPSDSHLELSNRLLTWRVTEVTLVTLELWPAPCPAGTSHSVNLTSLVQGWL